MINKQKKQRTFHNYFISTIYVLLSVGCSKPQVPEVVTDRLGSITSTSASVIGRVNDDGGERITDRGFVWDKTPNPDINSINIIYPESNDNNWFYGEINGLKPNANYFIRAFATNSIGTGYGNNLSFTTKEAYTGPLYQNGTVHCIDPPTVTGVITNPATGKIWMDRNLGASRVATSQDDHNAYGDLYQWGRFPDGHQCRNSGISQALSPTNRPEHGNFIISSNEPNDWRTMDSPDLWQGANGTNNPCPDGFKLPTAAEWSAEINSWSSLTSSGAINSPLRLPEAGFRQSESGLITNAGTFGGYWTSTASFGVSQRLYFDLGDAFVGFNNRGNAFSVRCIKD